jgi:hypothetical protein
MLSKKKTCISNYVWLTVAATDHEIYCGDDVLPALRGGIEGE